MVSIIWLVIHITIVPAAGAPAEEVAINVLVAAILACGGAKIIPLVLCKAPIRSGSTADVLQITLRELHLAGGTH